STTKTHPITKEAYGLPVRFRKPLLYPFELRDHLLKSNKLTKFSMGRCIQGCCIHAKPEVAFFDPFNFRVASSRSPGPTSRTTRKLIAFGGSHLMRLGHSLPPASLGADEIEEYAFVVVLQVGQVIGEIGEVVADADLQVLADMTIDRSQRAPAALTDIREVAHAHLSHAVPVLA